MDGDRDIRIDLLTAFKESIAQHEAVLDLIPVGLIMFNRDMTVNWVNRYAAAMLSMEPETMTGRLWYDLIPAMRLRRHIYELVLDGEGMDLTDQRVDLPEGARFFDVRYRPVRDFDGTVIGMLVVADDVTRRHVAQRDLGAMLEATSARTGRDFARTFVRQMAEQLGVRIGFMARLLGPTRAGTVALWRDGAFLENIEYDMRGTPCEDVPVKGFCLHAEGVRQRFPGDRWLADVGAESYAGIPLFDRDGRPVGHMGVVHDRPLRDEPRIRAIMAAFAARAGAELRREVAERELRGLNESLERRVAERTEEALRAERQLRQAQRLESIGRLAGGIAHDFNNLLMAITGFSELALIRTDPRRELEEIRRAAGRGADLVRQLLAFSRRQILLPRRVDLNAVVANVTDMLGRILGEDVRLEVEPEAGLPAAEVDPGRLEQALMNLAVNARDAMPGGGTLTIRTEAAELDAATAGELRPGRYVCVSVEDTGTGMDAETIEKIFEPFFTTKEPGIGTGLGLAMVDGFVRQSGGGVRVSSRAGEGSVFELLLPAAPAEAPPAESPPAESGGRTVLVAEDDAAVREVVGTALRQAGYDVIEVADGLDGVGAAEVDLVVTDVVMPRMGGCEMVRSIRARKPGVPVIYMSGFASDVTDQGGAAGSNSVFLQKPFASEELVRRVGAFLGMPGVSGTSA